MSVEHPLEPLIRKTIREKGPVSFAEFMALALYHPQYGYYSSVEPQQDYYTSVDVHSLFGEIIARFIAKEWRERFKPGQPFHVVELGCGWGKLARQTLTWLSREAPDCWDVLAYTGVETSAKRRKACADETAGMEQKARFVPEFDFPDTSLNGVVFSNEFFDALPFHRVIHENGQLKELLVGENLSEIAAEPSKEVTDYFEWLGEKPAEGCKGEAHVLCRDWMKKIGRALNGGTVLTVDYGHEAPELFSDARPEGTALCHYRHQTHREFYARAGEQDLTAHVNFTTLSKEGLAWGLQPEKLSTQSQFCLEHGLVEMVKGMKSITDARAQLKASSAIKSLIHPEGMGGTFKILVQRKPAP